MKSVSILFVVLLLSGAQARDFLFPSVNPPGDLRPDQVEQYITIIWDDNAYSGKAGTNYEGNPNVSSFTDQSWVNGIRSEGGWITTGNKNELNITEGDMGMSWATYTLAGRKAYSYPLWHEHTEYSPQIPDTVIHNDTIWACTDWPVGELIDEEDFVFDETPPFAPPQVYSGDIPGWFSPPWTPVGEVDREPRRINPDGSPITFTFNVISGLMVPTWPIDWQARESKYGYYVPNEEFYPEGTPHTERHSKIAASWGREMPIYETEDQETLFIEGYITQAYIEARDAGHEIGNHTLD
ncbi:hypothetical protein, partial [Chitinivibrio alkaliphilus]|uniref:hypothetical protein n=1 Tax=Chitinivibrio alkaliphilus TaxID=1505232 RepID=UPI00054D3056